MAIHGHVDNYINFLALSSLPMITQVVTPVSVLDVSDQCCCPKFPAAFQTFSEKTCDVRIEQICVPHKYRWSPNSLLHSGQLPK